MRGGASALLEDWRLERWRRSRIGARVARSRGRVEVGAAAVGAVVRRAWILPVLVSGTASLVVPLVLHPLVLHRAVMRAPTLRATLETMLTLFSLSAAWLLRAQFADSRRFRDLLFVCVMLALGVTSLCIYALPAALDLNNSAYLAAVGPWSQLFLAGIFAAAARSNRRGGRSSG